MKFSVISSGSKANCTYIHAGKTKLLIDCGLSAKQTQKRLESHGIDPGEIDGIVVTHEHRDHIQGVSVFSRRFSVPVYANKQTARFLERIFELREFSTGSRFDIGDIAIDPFRIVHDAVDPVGVRLSASGGVIGVATDLGKATPLVVNALQGCSAILLESNYDQDMLNDCHYPWQVKQRISSTHGHLSNYESAQLLDTVLHEELQLVVLGHLSENSNTSEKALETVKRFSRVEKFCRLICASQAEATALFSLDQNRPGNDEHSEVSSPEWACGA